MSNVNFFHWSQQDGAFLVRDCSMNTDSEPLVLSVYHEKRVFNVKIRYIETTSKYALGTQQHSNNVRGPSQFSQRAGLSYLVAAAHFPSAPQMFDSVADIIKFHSIFPIMLVSGRPAPGSRFPENCLLTCAVAKRDVDQLLQWHMIICWILPGCSRVVQSACKPKRMTALRNCYLLSTWKLN